MNHSHECKICNSNFLCSKQSCIYSPGKLCAGCRQENWTMFLIVGGAVVLSVAVIFIYRIFRG
ncbi:MAG TPA: hypothetical protein VF599_12675 [Pyrinomonadaceae bacterium]